MHFIMLKKIPTKHTILHRFWPREQWWPRTVHQSWIIAFFTNSKTCVKRPLSKRSKIGFQDKSLLNAGQKYCRMLQREHSAILSTFIKLPFVIKIFVFVWFDSLRPIKNLSVKQGRFVLFDLILYIPSKIFQLYRDGSSLVEPVLS